MAAEAAAILSIVQAEGREERMHLPDVSDPPKAHFWQVFMTLLFKLHDQESCIIVTEQVASNAGN